MHTSKKEDQFQIVTRIAKVVIIYVGHGKCGDGNFELEKTNRPKYTETIELLSIIYRNYYNFLHFYWLTLQAPFCCVSDQLAWLTAAVSCEPACSK